WLRDGKYPYRPAMLTPADVFRPTALARTMRELEDGGLDAYASGSLGPSISAAAGSTAGGLIDVWDVEAYEPVWGSAPVIPFRGLEITGPAHGGLYELLFSVLERLPAHLYPPLSAQRLHLIIEVLRRCRHLERMRLGDRVRALSAQDGLE